MLKRSQLKLQKLGCKSAAKAASAVKAAVSQQFSTAKMFVCSLSVVDPTAEQHHLSGGAWLFPEPGSAAGTGS